MRYSQSRHYDQRAGGYIIETYLHLDCGHRAKYYGGIELADEACLQLHITTMVGISRCAECTQRFMAMQNEINAISHKGEYRA